MMGLSAFLLVCSGRHDLQSVCDRFTFNLLFSEHFLVHC